MPQQEQKLEFTVTDITYALSLAFGTFQHLGWTAEYAGESRLVGYSKKKWNSYYDHIIVDIVEDGLVITSKLPESAAMDLFKKNKKNIARFAEAFGIVKDSITPTKKEQWTTAITDLQNQTLITLEKEEKQALEAEAVMKLTTGTKTVTYGLMAINIIMFIIMLIDGVHVFEPLISDLIKWGSNYKPYTINGEWWRLFTSTFIHIGIIHIAVNMYALYMVGMYLEPMLGKTRYLIAYISTGLLASVTSTWWHDENLVGAGASGAIFGLYGVLLALLTTKLIPAGVRKGLLQSMGIFVVYNLVYGAKSDATDNAAHIGGLVSGLAVGYLYFISLKYPLRLKPAIAAFIVAAATSISVFFYLQKSQDHTLAYGQKIEAFAEIERKAMEPIEFWRQGIPDMLGPIATISQVEWQKAKELWKETEAYDLNNEQSKHRKLLSEYIDLRIQYTDLVIISLQGNENVDEELEVLFDKIISKVDELNNTAWN